MPEHRVAGGNSADITSPCPDIIAWRVMEVWAFGRATSGFPYKAVAGRRRRVARWKGGGAEEVGGESITKPKCLPTFSKSMILVYKT